MPSHMGAWVETEKGIRRLMPEETSNGLGAPKEDRTTLLSSLLRCTTSLFHWEYLSSSLTLPPEGATHGNLGFGGRRRTPGPSIQLGPP
jgi:hypothetical protein